MGTMHGVMANLVKGLLVGFVGLLVLIGTAQANHQGHDAIEVVVRDGIGFPGEELEIPVGIDSKGQVVTSVWFEVHFPGAYLPSVTARTTFQLPEGWDVECIEHPVGMIRCIGAKAEGDVLTGNPIYLTFQVADIVPYHALLEIRIPQERIGFHFGPTRLPARGLSGTITILARTPQCNVNNTEGWCFI